MPLSNFQASNLQFKKRKLNDKVPLGQIPPQDLLYPSLQIKQAERTQTGRDCKQYEHEEQTVDVSKHGNSNTAQVQHAPVESIPGVKCQVLI